MKSFAFVKKLVLSKLLAAVFFLLSVCIVCTPVYSADVAGPAVLAAPSPLGNQMPEIQAAPSTPVMPSVPTVPQRGLDLSGLDPTQPQTHTENVDTTDPSAQQTPTDPTAVDPTTGENAPTLEAGEITEEQINEYFDELLSLRTRRGRGNPMSDLFRRLPRYGMSFFRRPPSTYAPMESVPVTQGYRIGVGDEMTLTIWGIPEEGNFRFSVNRDGMAAVPHIGTVRLAGYTLAEAERVLSARLSQYYTGFQMNLSMGRLSSIQVYVTGNAARPGAYTISSFSTLVNALIASGGPTLNGTLRRIELKRGGRTVSVFDMYAMLLQGDKTQDVRLQAGDVINIPTVGPLVGLAGEVHVPGVYELNGATRVQDLLYIAGGLNARTFKGRIQFYRIQNSTYASASEGTLADFENMELHDGDILRLYPIFNTSSTVFITGSVLSPGNYAITPGQTRISDLIVRAGGLTPLASDIIEVTRVTPSLEGPVNQRFKINIVQAMQGDPVHNIALENQDRITVIMIPDWKTTIMVNIVGEVRRPGQYAMFHGEKLSDLIERAGGFTPKAFLRGAIFTRMSVARDQRIALNQMADRMEREMLEASQNLSVSATTTGATRGINQEFQRRRQLIYNLRNMDIMGRVITKVDTPKNIIGTPWDYELENGDTLSIPSTPLIVNVMGAVYTSTSHVYRPGMGINAYINAAGGALKSAHKRMVYLIKSDGTTLRLTRNTSLLSSKQWTPPRGYSATVEPGDTIVVPVKYMDRQSIESFKDTIDVIYKVAVATGVIIRAVD